MMVLRPDNSEDGVLAFLLLSVVTSDTLVTVMIFSAATSRKVLAFWLASAGSACMQVIDTIRVSVGTVTVP